MAVGGGTTGRVETRPAGGTTDLGGAFLLLGAAMILGTTGTAQAMIPGTPDSLGVGTVRIAIGGVALTLMALASGGFRRRGRWPIWPVAFTALGVAFFQLLFFAGISRAGVAIGTIVAIGSMPVFAGMLGWAISGERPGGRWAIATATSVVGATLLVAASPGGASAAGVAMCIGASACYGVYTVMTKRLMLAGNSPSEVMAVAFGGAAVMLFPLLVTRDIGWVTQGSGVLVALHLGVVTTAIAHVVFGRGLRRVPVAVAATLSLAEPLTASLLGVVLLSERLGGLQWAGAALLLGGLVMLTVPAGARFSRLGRRQPAG